MGERIAREELGGAQRAEYGKRVIEQLANDLTARYGKGYIPAQSISGCILLADDGVSWTWFGYHASQDALPATAY